MAIEIPDSAAFYVRGAMNRSLQKMQDDIQKLHDVTQHPEIMEAIRNSIEGIEEQARQLYEEAVAEFRELPESIRPNADLLNYDPWKTNEPQ